MSDHHHEPARGTAPGDPEPAPLPRAVTAAGLVVMTGALAFA